MTAREQVGLLVPWRTAAEDARWVGPLNTPDSDQGGTPGKQRIKYPEATQRVIDDVHAATGVKLDVENTGGNTYVLSGRCHEDGSWLVVGDHTDGDIWWDLAHRHREEAEEGPKGWYAAVYRNQVGEDGSEHWGFDPQKGHSTEPYHIHEDEHGTVHDLPRVVSETLATMPRGQMPTGNPATPERDDLDDDFGDIFGKQSMRRVAFDWKPDDAAGGGERYRAALENGHVLAIQDHGGKYGWNWALFTNEESAEHGPIKQLVTGGGSHWEGMPGFYSADHIPTREHARTQAEQAYRELYPIGSDTGGGHDSGVDYSDLGKFMGEL